MGKKVATIKKLPVASTLLVDFLEFLGERTDCYAQMIFESPEKFYKNPDEYFNDHDIVATFGNSFLNMFGPNPAETIYSRFLRISKELARRERYVDVYVWAESLSAWSRMKRESISRRYYSSDARLHDLAIGFSECSNKRSAKKYLSEMEKLIANDDENFPNRNTYYKLCYIEINKDKHPDQKLSAPKSKVYYRGKKHE